MHPYLRLHLFGMNILIGRRLLLFTKGILMEGAEGIN
jgi:hypothetical protein